MVALFRGVEPGNEATAMVALFRGVEPGNEAIAIGTLTASLQLVVSGLSCAHSLQWLLWSSRGNPPSCY